MSVSAAFDEYQLSFLPFFFFRMPANFPMFVNLKHLKLYLEKAAFEEKYSLLKPMVTFFKAFPFLRELKLRVSTIKYYSMP